MTPAGGPGQPDSMTSASGVWPASSSALALRRLAAVRIAGSAERHPYQCGCLID
jgi:hypothetical protein